MEVVVWTRKQTDRPWRTHPLETAERGACQDTDRNRPSEVHSLPGDGRGRYLSGHRNKPTDQGALTDWRQQREGLVRTWKEIDRPRRTYLLEPAEGGTCQDTGKNRPTKVHSLSGYGRGRDLSGHGNKRTNQGALTFWRRQREELVKTRKEKDRARLTHSLETAEGGTFQDTERKHPSKAHSPPGDRRGRDLSGYGRKQTERGKLTNWR